MVLKQILIGLEGLRVKGDMNIEISNISSDSNQIEKDGLFIAIKGYETDGHQYLEQAIEHGAVAVMVEEGIDLEIIKHLKDVTIIMAPNTRLAQSICGCNFYENPSKKLKLIGVTGTKGKTTTTFMIKSILEKAGKKVGLLGTIATYIGDQKIEDSTRTTPEGLKLQYLLSEMVKQEVEVAVMEVSSQSLKLDRVAGCDFDIGIFTNLSEDHISEKEHANMQEYFEAKSKLFDMCKIGYTNADDVYGNKLRKIEKQCEFKTFGLDNPADLLAKDITVTNSYADFKVKLGTRNERVKVCIPGRFSVYNALAAISVANRFGVSTEVIKEALLEVRVPGRSELVDNKAELTIMIDYAHTPDSLFNILDAVKSYTVGRVICVFGCGGDRDKTKREAMGEVAGEIADYSIITSDNPRTENPETIIQEIEKGIKKTKGNYTTITDRKEAIKHAIHMANKRDIVILAGKGHEPYQEINHKVYPFDERVIVRQLIDEMENQKKKKKK